ncbi:alpha/beta fold hydrolase [Pedobacter sp. P26]|uniref:alpha/beta fold hydrolase n=1 Tax=Pedobacter sp. P26 TaxID=3423956 RepID=UPI003D667E78
MTDPLSYDLYAEDMKILLDSLHINKTNILGWSDGGNTGLIMAAKYPKYVDKLAVTGACTNPNDAVSTSTLEEVRKAIESLKTKLDAQSKYQVKLFTMLLTEPHLTALDLKKIKAPVLVMAGEKDMILEKHTKFIADNIPKSQLFIFKGASHYVPVEKVSEFNTEVLTFLNQ